MSKRICGVDEAGRGSLIGPMVLAGVLSNKGTNAALEALGVKDSKLLSKKRREALYPILVDLVDFRVEIINPGEIDRFVESKTSTLNVLEAILSAKIIRELRPDVAIVDCPSVNIKKYEGEVSRRLSNHNKNDISLMIEHKADFNHIEVAAASIIAKVTRDREIEEIKKTFDIEFGSGYPADDRTVQFLKKSQGNYPIFRKSWATWKRYIKE